MLLTFCIFALFQLWVFGTGQVDWVFPQRDYIFAPYTGQHSIAIRTYIVSFYIAFACYGSGSAIARLFFGFDLVLRFLVICCLLDLLNTVFLALVGEPYSLAIVQIISGLIGFALFSLMLLERGSMPAKVDMSIGEQKNLRPVLRLASTAVIAAALSGFVGYSNFAVVEGLRDITLLGGIGPGVLLFLPLLFLQLYIISLIERRLDANDDYRSPVSIIVPAFNERYIIAETIRHIDEAAVIAAVDPAKDVDGFHVVNAGRLATGQEALVPCTPMGCIMLLKDELGDLSGKEAVIIGRSNIVGKPMAQLLLAENATVTIAHSRTHDLASVVHRADVVVAAVGRPEMVKGEWIKPGATVIDVGINRVADTEEEGKSRIVGDVATAEALAHVRAITPVPGGVGPMTIAVLLRNTLVAAHARAGLAKPEGL